MLLVAVVLEGGSRAACEEHLDELALLAATAGYEVRGRVIQDRGRPEAATLLGRGKVAEVAQFLRTRQIGRVLMDDDLTPQQGATLEKELGVPVADRAGLILDIFASRARTREARTQVELASLRYLLPRLARRWTHLSRQEGGIGVRGGVGETQIEVDRRMIRRRISRLERDLALIKRCRRNRRRGRRGVYTVALVGYTNSGKTTLFNSLTHAGALVEDRLFATLDPLRRRVRDGSGHNMVVTDTVGFIRKLPHHLVASFRSTLEEAGDADVLVQVVDASDPHRQEKMETTRLVLGELELENRPRLVVFSKADACADVAVRRRLLRQNPGSLLVSARGGEGMEELLATLGALRAAGEMVREVCIATGDGEALAVLHRHGRVLGVLEESSGLRIRYLTDAVGAGRIRQGLEAARAHA